jgi:21S rRNA (uridine2791-2'-O)-methyltransferase
MAALTFCFDTLRTGGNFICKFYQGAEDKALEKKLKTLFEKVHREKPESSRNVGLNFVYLGQDDTDMIVQESKEAYFVALRRKEAPERDEIFK